MGEPHGGEVDLVNFASPPWWGGRILEDFGLPPPWGQTWGFGVQIPTKSEDRNGPNVNFNIMENPLQCHDQPREAESARSRFLVQNMYFEKILASYIFHFCRFLARSDNSILFH